MKAWPERKFFWAKAKGETRTRQNALFSDNFAV
jgi:hypothetical protein